MDRNVISEENIDYENDKQWKQYVEKEKEYLLQVRVKEVATRIAIWFKYWHKDCTSYEVIVNSYLEYMPYEEIVSKKEWKTFQQNVEKYLLQHYHIKVIQKNPAIFESKVAFDEIII